MGASADPSWPNSTYATWIAATSAIGVEPHPMEINEDVLIWVGVSGGLVLRPVVAHDRIIDVVGCLKGKNDRSRRVHAASRSLGMKYKVALQESEEGFSVSVPGLPGCWSQGDTEEEALSSIEDAILNYLAAVREQLRGEEVREVEVVVYSCQRSPV
jgi:predicted RNase H-like HicB family nuclease